MTGFEVATFLLGLLAQAPELLEAVDRILAALQQKSELTDAQWAEVKARRQAMLQQDHWKV